MPVLQETGLDQEARSRVRSCPAGQIGRQDTRAGGGERRRCDGGSRGQGVPEKGLPAKECEQVLEKGKGLSQSGLL